MHRVLMLKMAIIAAALLGSPIAGLAQDAALADLHQQKARLAAQIEELRKITIYQQNLLALAREDAQAAFDARRDMGACIENDGAGPLCPALSTSYAAQGAK